MSESAWQTLSSKTILDISPWFSVIEDTLRLPSGKIVNDYYRIESPDYVLITASKEDGAVLLERHYKQCLQKSILTSPAGGVEAGETPLIAAKRELLEETGYATDDWKYMGAFTVDGTRGFCKAHLFSAQKIRKIAEPVCDEMERFDLVFMTIDEIVHAFRDNDITLLPDLAILAMATNDLFSSLFEECEQ